MRTTLLLSLVTCCVVFFLFSREPTSLRLDGGMIKPPAGIIIPPYHGLMEVRGFLTDGHNNSITNASIEITATLLENKAWDISEKPISPVCACVKTNEKGVFCFSMIVPESKWEFKCVFYGNQNYSRCERRIVLDTGQG